MTVASSTGTTSVTSETPATAAPATPGPTAASERDSRVRAAWLLPAGLITLGLTPIIANALRRIALAVGEGSLAAAGSAAPPPAALLHTIGSTVFVLLGAWQFSTRFRQRHPSWHRISGRVLIAAGALAAGTGLWLSVTVTLPAGGGVLLLAFRLLAGLAMLTGLVLGFIAILRRNIRRHGAWMIRAYAIGLGAGTQVFTLGFGQAIFGETQVAVALLNGAGWVINLAVAEVVIRGFRRRRPRAA